VFDAPLVKEDEDKVLAEIARMLERVRVTSLEEAEELRQNGSEDETVLDIRLREDGTEQADVIPNGRMDFDRFQKWLRHQAKRLDDALRADTSRTVVVHCRQGRSRSPLVVVAYLRIYKAVDMAGAMIAYEVLRSRPSSTRDSGHKKTDSMKFLASLELINASLC
jgi:protein-tyrosine phosphatase